MKKTPVFKDIVRRFREALGIQQNEFAQAFGVSRVRVNEWEHLTSPPSRTDHRTEWPEFLTKASIVNDLPDLGTLFAALPNPAPAIQTALQEAQASERQRDGYLAEAARVDAWIKQFIHLLSPMPSETVDVSLGLKQVLSGHNVIRAQGCNRERQLAFIRGVLALLGPRLAENPLSPTEQRLLNLAAASLQKIVENSFSLETQLSAAAKVLTLLITPTAETALDAVTPDANADGN
jgi:transcriptional regulator with XRE-family HTH domain